MVSAGGEMRGSCAKGRRDAAWRCPPECGALIRHGFAAQNTDAYWRKFRTTKRTIESGLRQAQKGGGLHQVEEGNTMYGIAQVPPPLVPCMPLVPVQRACSQHRKAIVPPVGGMNR